MIKTDDVHIKAIKELLPPIALLEKFPATEEISQSVAKSRNAIHNILSNNPDSNVTIFGYPSSGGSSSYSRMLSENRVYTVKMYLLGKGLEPSKTKVVLDEKRVTPPVDGVELIIRFPQ